MNILRSLFAREPVQFRSSYRPDEAAARLQAVVKRASLFINFSEEEALVGKVSIANVSVCRQRPFHRNSFVPWFRGTFRVQGGITTLDGYFMIHWFPRWFMIFWLVMLSGFAVTAWGACLKQNVPWIAALPFIAAPVAMAFLGLLIAHVGIRSAHDDRRYISEAIQNAIRGPA